MKFIGAAMSAGDHDDSFKLQYLGDVVGSGSQWHGESQLVHFEVNGNTTYAQFKNN